MENACEIGSLRVEKSLQLKSVFVFNVADDELRLCVAFCKSCSWCVVIPLPLWALFLKSPEVSCVFMDCVSKKDH